MPRVRLISGAARSDRVQRMDALLLDRLGESLLIVPSGAYARRRAATILARTGRTALLDPPVITLGELVGRLLRRSPVPAHRVEPLEQRMLLGRAVARVRAAGRLEPLGAAGESEGFLDHLLSVIGQIKQAAIEPKLFRQRVRGRRHAMDGIVAEVYAAYQDELKSSGSVDLPGMYWLARIECETAARPAGLGATHRLLLDDFDDFTPSEFGVIKAISRHLEDLVFGMNVSADPEQQSLYAVPLRTVQKIREEFDRVEAADPFPEAAPVRRSEFIAASLLVRKNAAVPAGLADDVEFIECHTVEHEIETIARRIKRLVRTEGVALPEIAVVWRNTASVAGAAREIFREFGIPLAGLENRTLDESAAAGFLLRFLDAAQTWSPAGVLDVLTSPWFAGPRAPHAGTYPILARAARVRPSRNGWRGGLERLRRYLDDPRQMELKGLVEHVPDVKAACEAMIEAFDRFAGLAEDLPRSATVAGHIAVLQTAIDQWRWDAAIGAMPAGDERALEEAAVAALNGALGALHRGYTGAAEKVTRGAFARMLRRSFGMTPVNVAAPEGAVTCLGMEPARYLSFDYVFLAGLTDVQVPSARKTSAIYSDDDRSDLSAAGVPLDHAATHNQREILLFQRMFSTARRRLVASWHRVSPGGGTVQRSLYLNEIADRLGGLHEEKTGSPEDALVPRPELAGCARDAQNIAIQRGAVLRFPEIAAAAALERRRYQSDPFDAHDGALADADSLESLRETFDASHEFSPSQLETYADCPFRFFQERVLRLFAIEPPEQAFDHLARGSVLHGALERFHRRYLGKPVNEIPSEEAVSAMGECAGEAFDEVALRFRNLSPGVLAAERARTIETLQRHLRLQRAPKKNAPEPWPPALFEIAFGRAGEETGGPPFVLDTESGEVRLAGRIDRVDRRGAKFRLVDYKSSPVHVKNVKAGKVFQLALYALAAEAIVLPGEQCEDALYLPVGHDKNPAVALSRTNPKARWDDRIELARRAVADAVAGIRAGRFHPTLASRPCARCSDQKVCRFERARIQRKLKL
jgi:ATP-dependent helicase/DNAse subunit B